MKTLKITLLFRRWLLSLMQSESVPCTGSHVEMVKARTSFLTEIQQRGDREEVKWGNKMLERKAEEKRQLMSYTDCPDDRPPYLPDASQPSTIASATIILNPTTIPSYLPCLYSLKTLPPLCFCRSMLA